MNSLPVLDINLERIIDKVLVNKAQKSDRDYTHFHPSEFCQCHRKLVYKYYETKGICTASEKNAILFDARLQRIFDNGHSLHARLGGNLAATGLLKGRWACVSCHKKFGFNQKFGINKPSICECNSSKFHYIEVGFLDEETMLGGHVDIIIDLSGQEVNGQLIPKDASVEESHLIVDFKSIRSEMFKTLSSPKDDHFSQMQIYLYLSGLKFGKFLYENKNDQMFREYLVVRDENFIEKMVHEAKGLKKIVTSTNSAGKWTLPPRAHKKDNTKECIECSFRSHCWNIKK